MQPWHKPLSRDHGTGIARSPTEKLMAVTLLMACEIVKPKNYAVHASEKIVVCCFSLPNSALTSKVVCYFHWICIKFSREIELVEYR